MRRTDYITNWEEKRQDEIKDLTGRGILPVQHDADQHPDSEEILDNLHPQLMGVVAGVINQKGSAREIVDEMVSGAAERLRSGGLAVVQPAKL